MLRKPLRFLLLLGFLVSFPAQADGHTQRIISVDSNTTEVLLALGVGDQIVAADVTSQSLLSTQVPDLGYHRTLSAEGILQSNPDWVIGSEHMGPPETLEILKKASLKLVQLNSPKTLPELTANVMMLGEQLDREEQAKRLIADIQTHQQALPQQSDSGPRMIFLLDLGDRGLSQAGRGTTADALINLLGGNNISDFGGYKSVSTEALLAINPDVILLGQRDDAQLDDQTIRQRHPLLSHTMAGEKNNIIGVNAAKLIAGLSLGAIDEAERIHQQLQP